MTDKIEGLELARVEISRSLREAEATLSQRRLYKNGRMLSQIEYDRARQPVLKQKNDCTARLQQINVELKALRRLRNEAVVAAMGVDVQDPVSLIAHAHKLLHRLASEGVDLDSQELAIVDGLQHYLTHVRTDLDAPF